MLLHKKIRTIPYWVCLVACFLTAPFCTRIALLMGIGEGMQQADLAGFASDLIICLISVIIFILLSKWSKIATMVFILFWSLFHYFNYEHVTVNSDIVSLGYANHLLSPTFLFGSGFAFSNIFLLLTILAFSFAVFRVKPVQLNILSIIAILVVALGAVITRNGFTCTGEHVATTLVQSKLDSVTKERRLAPSLAKLRSSCPKIHQGTFSINKN